MSDEVIAQTGADSASAKAGGIKGFFATTVGKVVIIGGAVGLLVAVIGIVAFLLLTTFVNTAVNDAITPATTGAGATVASATIEATAPPVAQISNRDVFTPRNPFEPVKAPASAFRDPDGSSSSGVSRGTVYLERIVAASGSEPAKAVVWYGSTAYTLAEGQAVPNSSWLVYDIRSDRVVMQYGDDYVTLWPGSGVNK